MKVGFGTVSVLIDDDLGDSTPILRRLRKRDLAGVDERECLVSRSRGRHAERKHIQCKPGIAGISWRLMAVIGQKSKEHLNPAVSCTGQRTATSNAPARACNGGPRLTLKGPHPRSLRYPAKGQRVRRW